MNEKTAKVLRRYVLAAFPEVGAKADAARLALKKETSAVLGATNHRERGRMLARMRSA